MTKNKLAFFISLSPLDKAFPLKVINDPKYDNNPLINKEEILKAIKKYDKKSLKDCKNSNRRRYKKL